MLLGIDDDLPVAIQVNQTSVQEQNGNEDNINNEMQYEVNLDNLKVPNTDEKDENIESIEIIDEQIKDSEKIDEDIFINSIVEQIEDIQNVEKIGVEDVIVNDATQDDNIDEVKIKKEDIELKGEPKILIQSDLEKFNENAVVIGENNVCVTNEQLREINDTLESNEIHNKEDIIIDDFAKDAKYVNTVSINPVKEPEEQKKIQVEKNSRQALAPSPPPIKELNEEMKTPIEEKFIWDDSVDDKGKESVKTEVKVEKSQKVDKDKADEKEEISVGSLRSVLRKPKKQRSVDSELTTSSGERLSALWRNEDWTKEGLWGSETGLKHVENRSKIGQSKVYAAVKSRPRSFDIDVSRVNKSPTESVDEEKDEGYDSYSSRLIKTSTPIHQDSISMSLSTSNRQDSFYSNSGDRRVPPLNLDSDANGEVEAVPILRTRDVKKSESINEKPSEESKGITSSESEKITEDIEPINKQEDNKVHITSVYIGDDRITMTTGTTEDDISSLNEENVDAFVQNLSSDSSDEEELKKSPEPSSKRIDMRDDKGGYSHTKQTDVDQIKPVRKPSINLLTARPFTQSNKTTEAKKENDRKSYRKDYDSLQKQMQQWQDRLQKNQDVLDKGKPKKQETRPNEDPVGLYGQFTSTQLSSVRGMLRKSETREKTSGVQLGRVLEDNPSNGKPVIPQSPPPPPPPPTSNIPPPPPAISSISKVSKEQDSDKRNKPPTALKLKSDLEDKPKSRFGPVLDPHEELMLAIKSVNGRGALRKVR